MRRKKVITLLISLTLLVSIAIPGTLAVSNDQEAASGSVTLPSGEQENNASAEGTKPAESPKPSETEQEPEKTCTCESTDGTHKEDCPLYTAPAEQDKCTCDPKPAEGEAHQKGCPLYVEQTEALEEVEILYRVVGPENCGTLDIESERLPLPGIGTGSGSAGESLAAADLNPSGNSAAALGAAPTAAEGFRFVGWYKDEACTQPVDASWVSDNKLIPGKTKNYGTAEAPVMGYEAATYYARFENETASLTITMQSWSEETDENQRFFFDVTGSNGYSKRVVINGNGSVTIKGLIAGEYSIKEVTGWSWRYHTTGSSKIITLQPSQSETVSFSSNQNEHEWLSGDAYKKITFGN